MTVEPKGRSGASDEVTGGSLEPTDAWIGLELSSSASERPAPDPVYGPRRSRGGIFKIAAAALLVGVGGAWFVSGSTPGPTPDIGFEQATGSVTEDAKPEDDTEDKAAAKELEEVEGKRTELLNEIKQLESQRTQQQDQLSELADRRSNLNEELGELERQRQEWLQQLTQLEAQSKTGEGAPPPADGDASADASPPGDGPEAAVVPAPQKKAEPQTEPEKPTKTAEDREAGPAKETKTKPPVKTADDGDKEQAKRNAAAEVAKLEEARQSKAEQGQKVEDERKAKAEAVATLQRKEEDAQRRASELQERKAKAERALARRSERELARAEARAPSGSEESEESLQNRLFGFGRRQRSPEPPARSGQRQRVFVQFTAGDSDSRDRAHALADRLQARGYEVVELRAVRGKVRGNSVRYFHERSRGNEERRSASGQEFRDYPRPPRDGTLDFWIGD